MTKFSRSVTILGLMVGFRFLTGCLSTDSTASIDDLDQGERELKQKRHIDEAISSVNHHENDESEDDATLSDELKQTSIPIEINEAVTKWITFFSVKDRERFQRFLSRGEQFRPMIISVLKDQGIPTELYYQAMIESGFAVHASSRASAVGIWQFIKGTGKRYGLYVDRNIDERRDPLRATVAASLYLKDLYNVFQSWYLAMAAYNAGEGRILTAIMKAKTRNFWEIARLGYLPAETMEYIPKFLAATIIGHNPQKYGFANEKSSPSPTLVAVTVPSPIRLFDIAETTGIDLEILKTYNPHLMSKVTPSNVSTYRIWIPKENAVLVENQANHLANLVLRSSSNAIPNNGVMSESTTIHRVQQGDTLGKIANMYGMSIAQLKKVNKLRGNRINPGRRLTVINNNDEEEPVAAESTRYTVRAGDNLEIVAKRFKVSINELKRLNNLRRDRIFVGQVLKLTPLGTDKG